MDYQEASNRLDKPRKKSSKKIGHQLVLFRSKWSGSEEISLHFRSTDIITYYPDGTLAVSDGGWAHKRITQEKINRFLPNKWRLELSWLPFSPRHAVGVLCQRNENWETLRAIPYRSGARFSERGRLDLGEANNEYSAYDTLSWVRGKVESSVYSFLEGKLQCDGNDMEAVARLDVQFDRREKHLVAEVKELSDSATILWLQRNLNSKRELNLILPYWGDVYQATGKAKTLKQQMAQLEVRMKHPELQMRERKNSSNFHAMKKALLGGLERFLLERMGFQVTRC